MFPIESIRPHMDADFENHRSTHYQKHGLLLPTTHSFYGFEYAGEKCLFDPEEGHGFEEVRLHGRAASFACDQPTSRGA